MTPSPPTDDDRLSPPIRLPASAKTFSGRASLLAYLTEDHKYWTQSSISQASTAFAGGTQEIMKAVSSDSNSAEMLNEMIEARFQEGRYLPRDTQFEVTADVILGLNAAINAKIGGSTQLHRFLTGWWAQQRRPFAEQIASAEATKASQSSFERTHNDHLEMLKELSEQTHSFREQTTESQKRLRTELEDRLQELEDRLTKETILQVPYLFWQQEEENAGARARQSYLVAAATAIILALSAAAFPVILGASGVKLDGLPGWMYGILAFVGAAFLGVLRIMSRTFAQHQAAEQDARHKRVLIQTALGLAGQSVLPDTAWVSVFNAIFSAAPGSAGAEVVPKMLAEQVVETMSRGR